MGRGGKGAGGRLGGDCSAEELQVSKSLKRYSLSLPIELFNEVKKLADRKHTTIVELLRRFVKLGLLAARVDESPDMVLMIRQGETEREIIFL